MSLSDEESAIIGYCPPRLRVNQWTFEPGRLGVELVDVEFNLDRQFQGGVQEQVNYGCSLLLARGGANPSATKCR